MIKIKAFKLKELVLAGVFFIIIIGNIFNLTEDIREDGFSFFIVVQFFSIAVSVGGLYLLLRVLLHRQQEISRLTQKVEQTEGDLQQSLTKLKTLATAYNKQLLEQFNLWKLTAGEQEIALLILKGLSFKEVAEIRNRQEKTVRQQASSIYRKSGVNGRHEFSAWFFEDMLG